jgi:hypothetical protein
MQGLWGAKNWSELNMYQGLWPQRPNYHPAEMLLKLIQAQEHFFQTASD